MTIAHYLDLDGTLNMSEFIRQQFWMETTIPFIKERYSVDADLPKEVFHSSLGLASKDIIPAVRNALNAVLSIYGIKLGDEEVKAIYDLRNATLRKEDYEVRGYPLREEVPEMLHEFKGHGDILTIVTNSTVALAQQTLIRGDVDGLISAVVGCDTRVGDREIVRKPHYEPYAVSRGLVDQIIASGVLHIGAEDTAPGLESTTAARERGYLDQAVHIQSVQTAQDIADQLAQQSKRGLSSKEWLSNFDLTDATFGDYLQFVQALRR